jgi:hypothetical protein
VAQVVQVVQETMELGLVQEVLVETVLVQQLQVKVLETLVVHQMVTVVAVVAVADTLLVQPFKQIHKTQQTLKVAMVDLVPLA